MSTYEGSDTIRILLTTDNHVGYNESDPIRGQDSARTFREAMEIARNREVDMILQGGDLFHINKPTRKSMYDVITAVRTACYGDKPCELELLNEVDLGLEKELNHINYEDPNINVAIPFFGISGNHDDAAGDSLLSPMDVLAATGLINHFGQVPESDNITVSPILLKKGNTKLALYGLANVRDERLFRTFREGQVKFLRPEGAQEEWFNLMAVHQNHVAHTETSYLPETFLPDFLDFILWGHEHDCITEPSKNPETEFHVFQPGSSVATSLIEGEALPKHIAILSVTGKTFKLEKIRLKTVRPFVIKSVSLQDDSGIKPHPSQKGEISKWLTRQVESLIATARKDWLEAQDGPVAEEDIPLPLIRLKVEYTGGYEVENPRRFSNRFVGKVANVNDVVHFHKRRAAATTGKIKLAQVNNNSLSSDSGSLDNIKVQVLVEEYLKDSLLELLPENGMGEAISNFVDKDEKQAVKSFVDESLDIQVNSLLKLGDIDENTLVKAMKKAKIDLSNGTQRKSFSHKASMPRNAASRPTSTVSHLQSAGPPRLASSSRSMANIRSTTGKNTSNDGFGEVIGFLDTIVDDSESSTTPSSKKSRRTTKEPATTRGRNASRGRGSKLSKVTYAESEDDDEEEPIVDDNDDDDDFEDNDDIDIIDTPVPKLTRKSHTTASTTTKRKKAGVALEPTKPSTPVSSRIPWHHEEPAAKPARTSRATKASPAPTPRKTSSRTTRATKPAAAPKMKQTSLSRSGFDLIPASADPMDLDEDEDDGF